jgi:GNAT superfamily N-acetyltransferase
VTAMSRQRPDLDLRFVLHHHGEPYLWENFSGVRHWSAELVVVDSDSRDGPRAVIGTAEFVCVDTGECDDFFMDLDSFSGDLGQMADVVKRKVIEQDGYSLSDIRVLFVVDTALDPHWRGRGFGPGIIKITARAIANIDAIALIPAALRTEHLDGVWVTSYDRPRPGSAAQTKVRKAWKDAGFTRRDGQTYLLELDYQWCVTQAAAARKQLGSYRFTKHDRNWWSAVTG